MNKYPYLPPFKAFVLQNFPFIEEDFDALTYYEILCKIIEKLNLTAEQVEKISEIINDFDIQEEVNKKLDEMAEDGTLERLINQAILVNKVDYYKIDNTITDSDLQDLLNIERAKVIDFTDGTYNFTSTFRLNSHTKLLCNNAVINTTQTHLFFNFKDTDTTVLQYNGQHNIEIIGGTFNAGFSFLHAKNIKIKDCYFYHIINDHCIEICSCKNFKVENCKFEGVIAQASNRNHVENVQIDSCNHDSFPWLPEGSSTFDGTPNMNVTINKCQFVQPSDTSHQLYTAIGSHAYIDGSVHKNIVISNCTIEETINAGIRLHKVDNVKIYNNVIKSIGSYKNLNRNAIGFYNGADNIEIYNNIIEGYFRQLYIADNTGTVNINNNIFSDTPAKDPEDSWGNAIAFRGCRLLNITNNTFKNIYGGLLYNYDDSTSNNTVLNFSNNEIFMTAKPTEMIGNRCRIYGTDKIIIHGNNINEYELVTTDYFVRTDVKVTKISMSKNYYTDIEGKSTRLLSTPNYTGNYKNINNITFTAYSGNSNNLTNQALSFPYNNFNKMFIVCGGTASTFSQDFYEFVPIENKFEARQWIFSAWSQSGTAPEKCVLTFNSDGTFNFSSDSITLRKIVFENE